LSTFEVVVTGSAGALVRNEREARTSFNAKTRLGIECATRAVRARAPALPVITSVVWPGFRMSANEEIARPPKMFSYEKTDLADRDTAGGVI